MANEPDDVLGLAMGRLFRLRGVLDPAQSMPGVGASVSESLALARLAEGESTQHDLGSHLGLEKSTVSRLVDAMAHKGWVNKQRDPDNRRYQMVVLTAAGKHVATQVMDAMKRHHARWLGALTPEERYALTVGLTALVRAMSDDFGLDQPDSAIDRGGTAAG